MTLRVQIDNVLFPGTATTSAAGLATVTVTVTAVVAAVNSRRLLRFS